MEELLNELLKNRSLIAIYTNKKDTESFIVCRIIAKDDQFVLCYLYDIDGTYDGIEIKRIADIYLIEAEGDYLNKILAEITNVDIEIALPIEENLLFSFLRHAIISQKVVAIELVNSGIFDIVCVCLDFSGGVLRVSTISEGTRDSIAYIRISEITKLTYDSKAIMK